MSVTSNSLYEILLSRFRQFGGMKVVGYYAKMGVLWPMVRTILRNPLSRNSYKAAYSVAIQKVTPFLREKYAPIMLERKKFYDGQTLVHEKNKIVWFCWLQGMWKAPAVVKACYESLRRNLPDRDIKVIDAENWNEYVELPEHIVRRWEKKQIPPAHFTDLIRLQLLIKYGGTWIDSTVLCTGLKPESEDATSALLVADLFMFQYTRPGSDKWGGIGNWFISSCTNNEVLMVLRDMLYAYWKDYCCLLDYYIFHLFFTMLRDVYPQEIAAMPYRYAVPSITLVHHWGEKFDKEKWERFTSKVCFHKLAYGVKKEILEGKGNYYHYIVEGKI